MAGKPHIRLEMPLGEDRLLLHTCCAPCSSAIIECLLDNGIRPTIFYCNPNIYPEEEYLKRKEECSRYAAALGLDIVDDDYDHASWLRGVSDLLRGLPDSEADLASWPERGPRCLQCFRYRLYRSARYALAHGFRVMSTTLASSRWKSLEQINAAGRWAVDKALYGLLSPEVFPTSGQPPESPSQSNSREMLECPQPRGSREQPECPSQSNSREMLECLQQRGSLKQPECPSQCGGRQALVWWEQNWRKGGLQERRGELIREMGFYNQTWCGCEFSIRKV